MNQLLNPNENFLNHFIKFERELNGESESAIHQIRLSAVDVLKSSLFPTTKNEEWRFTNLDPIAKTNFNYNISLSEPTISKSELSQFLSSEFSATRLVFINGKYSDQLSEVGNLSGIIIKPLNHILKDDPDIAISILKRFTQDRNDYFSSLNTAFINDGTFILIPDNNTIDEPIYIVYLTTNETPPFVVHPRNIISIGKNSNAKIIEHYLSITKNIYLTNTVSNIYLDNGSHLEHIKLQDESSNSFHIGSTIFFQETESQLQQHSIMMGALLCRNELKSTLNGNQIKCTFNGLSISNNSQIIDNHTTIDHAKPNGESHELYKAILGGKSKGIFNGKIFVRKDAQKTDAKQTNRTLLLSDEATMDTKPQLEIFADDVKCTHGAAIGYLDAEAIFYLRSRGIGEDDARDLLTHAFANDIINRISIEDIRAQVNKIAIQRLQTNK
jgi:Fe-S cluster assembly protein SufD